jgi:hypothetical protein
VGWSRLSRFEKSTSAKYIGQVLIVKATKHTQALKIEFVRRQQRTSTFRFPPEDDIDTKVNLSAVVEILDKPVMNSRMQFKFANVNAVVYG